MKKRILHIITHLPVGGAQDNTLLTVHNLDKTRYHVTLLCGPGGDWTERARRISDVELVVVPWLVRPVHPISDCLAVITLYRFIKKRRCHLVHTHSSKAGVLGRLAATLARTPHVIHTIHGFSFHDGMARPLVSLLVWIERLLSRFTERMITVSTLNRDKALLLGMGVQEQYRNIYSGIDFAKFHRNRRREEIRSQLGIPAAAKVIGFVGRLSRQKNPELLIQAMPGIAAKHPESLILFVGDGELRGHMERMISTLKIKDRCLILGFREDIARYYSIFDVFVLPSRWEGLGRSLTEAMYMGCPVVATAVEGVPELIEHGKTGLLVPPGNREALEEAVSFMLDNPHKARSLAVAGHNRVRGSFNAAQMVQSIDSLYRELMDGGRTGSLS